MPGIKFKRYKAVNEIKQRIKSENKKRNQTKKLLHLLKDRRVFIMRIYKRLLIVEISIAYSCKHLFIISNFINELFRGCPAETGVGNGFTVNAFAHLLAAVFDVAFNHQTLNQTVNVRI